MEAGRKARKGKGSRDRIGRTSIMDGAPRARVSELVPVCISPYRPAACNSRNMRPDTRPHLIPMPKCEVQKLLASYGASTHVHSSHTCRGRADCDLCSTARYAEEDRISVEMASRLPGRA